MVGISEPSASGASLGRLMVVRSTGARAGVETSADRCVQRITAAPTSPATRSDRMPAPIRRLVRPLWCTTVPVSAAIVDLDLQFGGTEAKLELGGLALQSVRLECGATDATLDFSQPNRAHMRELDVSVGAAGFTALAGSCSIGRRLLPSR